MIIFFSVAVLCPLCIAFTIAGFGVLDRAKVDTDFNHYAEKADPSSFLKMPANALVNIAYSLVGIYWINYTRKKEGKYKMWGSPWCRPWCRPWGRPWCGGGQFYYFFDN